MMWGLTLATSVSNTPQSKSHGSTAMAIRFGEIEADEAACDGDTRSEIVIPLLTPAGTIGVLDLDSVAHGTFDVADKVGLERIADILKDACDWE